MTYARARLVCGSVMICAALLVGCTDAGSGPGGGTTRASNPDAARSDDDAETGSSTDTDTGAGALPAVSPTEQADPAKQPHTAAEAWAFVRKVIADPELVGSGAAPGTPYESDPNTWAVLGENCAWRREGLPEDVLATLTRHFEVPASGAEGSVRMSTTVTVHRTALDAAWEQAGMLEEAVGCPEQTLRAGERLTDLSSVAVAWGESANTSSDDSLSESGACVSDTRGGPYPYSWTQSVFGPVVISASSCGGQEGTTGEVDVAVRMLLRVQDAIGSPTGAGSASPDPATPSDSPTVGGKKGGE
ncbi:hypothetical protein PV367_21645 [Streptomyces europaeiscabiei]|uniref:Secreted protein n=1 Tax=Streptomyces europaeiscabiei TaxID=146819 RepID=A0AAJ2PRU1_9ACTN|nr:hypothetical protein [Streptomyces europaeiscabiei]MDX3132337.1 hypothetical protein [Streptomyces europaeiscabiei]